MATKISPHIWLELALALLSSVLACISLTNIWLDRSTHRWKEVLWQQYPITFSCLWATRICIELVAIPFLIYKMEMASKPDREILEIVFLLLAVYCSVFAEVCLCIIMVTAP